MVKEPRRISLLKRHAELKRAETRLDNARKMFREELEQASREDKSSYAELGGIVGLSRQRIHQLISGS
jgi:hypothetical protein